MKKAFFSVFQFFSVFSVVPFKSFKSLTGLTHDVRVKRFVIEWTISGF